jgi:hypothetical protein
VAGQSDRCPFVGFIGLAGVEDRHKPPRGDEARLFEQFNDELMRKVARNVQTSREVIEDACAIAWSQFLSHQPDRDGQTGRPGCESLASVRA